MMSQVRWALFVSFFAFTLLACSESDTDPTVEAEPEEEVEVREPLAGYSEVVRR